MRTVNRPPRARRLLGCWCVLVLVGVAAACGGSGAGEPVAEPLRPVAGDGSSGERTGAGSGEVDLSKAVAVALAASGRVTPPNPFEICGMRPEGEVVCWGSSSAPAFQPEGMFVAISHGLTHGCGLRVSGEVDCWGAVNLYGELDAPEGRFAAISASGFRTCGLRLDGSVECWGGVAELLEGVEPPVADVAFVGGVFTSVSVGGAHVCGLRPDGEATCWGANWFGQADAPPGTFVAVDAGASHSCGLHSDGSVTCWGEDSLDAAQLVTFGYQFGGDEQAYAANLRDIDASAQGIFETFGFTGQYLNASRAVLDLEGAVPEVELRQEMARHAAQWEPPAGPFVAVSAGEGFTCGLRFDGEAACWGYYAREEPRIPLEVYAAVYGDRLWDFHDAVEAQVERGLDGFDPRFYPLYESLYGARVWELDPSQYLLVGHDLIPREPASASPGAGRPPEYLIEGPEMIPVESMVSDLRLIDPPPGPFVAVEAGQWRACGLRPDGELDCWGFEGLDSAPPPGPFATAPITAAAAAP